MAAENSACVVWNSHTCKILESVNSLDLPYTVEQETSGDGNCFFRALIQALHADNDFQFRDHLHLRTQLVSFMRNNAALQRIEVFRTGVLAYVRQHKFVNESNLVAWHRLLDHMGQSGVWAEDIFIVCSAFFLKRVIKITSSAQSQRHPWLTFTPLEESIWKKPLTLGIVPNIHFQFLSHIKDTSRCKGCGRNIQYSMLSHLHNNKNCLPFYDGNELREQSRMKHNVQKKQRRAKVITFSESIANHLRKLQVPFHLKKEVVVGNNSLYHSLFELFSETEKEIYKSGDNLRVLLAQFLRSKHALLQADFFKDLKSNHIQQKKTNGKNEQETWQRILGDVGLNTVFPDSFVVQCLAIFLGRTIKMTSDEQNKSNPWQTFPSLSEEWAFPYVLYERRGICYQPLHVQEIPYNTCLSCGKATKSLLIHVGKKNML
jgi:hypothetical protein